ncbi:MazG-like family protein [Salinicoccus sp. HZC-1]|uniref:MazG-like family protein n=1 Tax=Salinicoccus sp. HZC-1 TaxID=3385497 RepID=UPI00398B5AD8
MENFTDLIKQWAVDRNLHTADPNKQMLKLVEEFGELGEAMAKGNENLFRDALGDMYVVMTILAMQKDIDIEDCINLAYNEIKDRKGKMIDGVFVKESDLA